MLGGLVNSASRADDSARFSWAWVAPGGSAGGWAGFGCSAGELAIGGAFAVPFLAGREAAGCEGLVVALALAAPDLAVPLPWLDAPCP